MFDSCNFSPCLARINDTHFMVAGGYQSPSLPLAKARLFDSSSGAKLRELELTADMEFVVCGSAVNKKGENSFIFTLCNSCPNKNTYKNAGRRLFAVAGGNSETLMTNIIDIDSWTRTSGPRLSNSQPG